MLVLAPRRVSMIKHSKVAAELIGLARNGILSQVTLAKALDEFVALEPHLVAKLNFKEIEKLTLALTRGLRTLMAWFRVYKQNKFSKRAVLKGADAWEESVLDGIAEGLVLSNKEKKPLQ